MIYGLIGRLVVLGGGLFVLGYGLTFWGIWIRLIGWKQGWW